MIPASLVIFAIQAGVQLGQKSYEIMVDKDFDRPLRLPMGDSLGEEAENVAKEFFRLKRISIGLTKVVLTKNYTMKKEATLRPIRPSPALILIKR